MLVTTLDEMRVTSTQHSTIHVTGELCTILILVELHGPLLACLWMRVVNVDLATRRTHIGHEHTVDHGAVLGVVETVVTMWQCTVLETTGALTGAATASAA